MKEYHKINTIFKRDRNTNKIIYGDYSLPEFEYLRHNQWIWEEKIDGTNIRLMYKMGKVRIGGKTDNAQIPAPLYEKLRTLITEPVWLDKFGDAQVCLYGEGYGKGIQKGGCYIPDGVDFVLFDVWINGWWLQRDNVTDIAASLKLKRALVYGQGTLDEAVKEVERGIPSGMTIKTTIAEGLILRPMIELFSRKGDRIITKIKHRDFAL